MSDTTATKPHGYRAYGTTGDITECWHCGKTGLKKTVKMRFLDADGSEYGETYIGSDCAARLLSGGSANGRLAARIMREAAAADRQCAEAVANSRRFLAYYAPFIARQENPAERGDRGAFIREYTRVNKTGGRDWSTGEWNDTAAIARAALACHREVIATGGASALR